MGRAGTSSQRITLLGLIYEEIEYVRDSDPSAAATQHRVQGAGVLFDMTDQRPHIVSNAIVLSALEIHYTFVYRNGARDVWSNVVCDNVDVMSFRIFF